MTREPFTMTGNQLTALISDPNLRVRRVYSRRNYQDGKFHKVEVLMGDELVTACMKFMKIDTGSASEQWLQVKLVEDIPATMLCKNCGK